MANISYLGSVTSFERKVKVAARRLFKAHPNGHFSDEQVFSFAKSAGLPVLFENSSYTLDPSAHIVFLVAFRGAGTKDIVDHFHMMRNHHVNP